MLCVSKLYCAVFLRCLQQLKDLLFVFYGDLDLWWLLIGKTFAFFLGRFTFWVVASLALIVTIASHVYLLRRLSFKADLTWPRFELSLVHLWGSSILFSVFTYFIKMCGWERCVSSCGAKENLLVFELFVAKLDVPRGHILLFRNSHGSMGARIHVVRVLKWCHFGQGLVTRQISSWIYIGLHTLIVKGAIHCLDMAALPFVFKHLLGHLIAISDQFDILISFDISFRQIGQLSQGLSIDGHVNHIVVFCKLSHALTHPFGFSQTAKRLDWLQSFESLILWLVLWHWRQVVAQKIVFFNCERIVPVVLFKFFVTGHQASLGACSSQTSRALFILHLHSHVFAQVLESLILTDILILTRLLNDVLGHWK